MTAFEKDGHLVVISNLDSKPTAQGLGLTETAKANVEALPIWVRLMAQGLPPVFKLDQLRNHLYAHQLVATGDLWHVIGYGCGAFLLGLLLLRKLPLSR